MNVFFRLMLLVLCTPLAFVFGQQIEDSIPKHDTFIIQSKVMNENRVINVWLPPTYKLLQDSLPVMYMADGGVHEDFPHIANTLAKLIEEGKIAPLILVGIENTQRRRDLTGKTESKKDKKIAPAVGGSEIFRAFIQQELFIEVNKRYKVTDERTIIGESLSGLFVMETFFLTPDLFDNYIAFDPSLWWNKHFLVQTASKNLAKLPQTKIRLWFAGSSAKDISIYTKKMKNILAHSPAKNLTWQYSDEPTETHATIFRSAKEKAILWTLGNEK